MSKSLTYVEIVVPQFSPDSPDMTQTFRFTTDVIYLPSTIDAIPSIKDVRITPAIISLGENLGQRASVEVIFRDHKHIFASESFDSGTFWGKFRGRYGLKLFGRSLTLYRGELGDALANMEARSFIIESTDGPSATGEYRIIAKDLLKLADGSKSQAPVLNNGFLLSDITTSPATMTLSPSGIGDEEYDADMYVAVGGNEIKHVVRDSYTKLLLRFNEGSGTTTDDESPQNHAMTMSGGPVISNLQSIQGGSSALFNGAGSITTPDHADWTVGSGDWTVEAWVRPTSLAANRGIISHATDANNYWTLRLLTTGAVSLEVVSGGVAIVGPVNTAAAATAVNTWAHVAVTRSGNNWTVWVNGASAATTTDSSAVPDFTGVLTIGAGTGVSAMIGNIDNLQFYNGVARYTATFSTSVDPSYYGSGDVLYVTASGLFNTTNVAHSAQDRVQIVLVYDAMGPEEIIADLLTTYAGVASSYYSLSSWTLEVATYLNTVYTAVITEPTDVNKLVSELIEQAGLVMWWDDVGQQIRLQVLHAIATTADTYDEDTMIMGSLDVKEQPEKRLTQVYTYFGKINPTVKDDQINNYRSTAFAIDEDAESEYGSAAIKKIYSRWIPDGGRSVADTLNEILLARFVTPPRRISFDLLRGAGTAPALGVGYQLSAWPFQDETGAAEMVPVQLTRLNPRADVYEVETEEMIFTGVTASSPDVHDVIIDSNIFDVNLEDMHDSLFTVAVSGITVNCTIQEGVTVGSTSTATPAFTVGSFVAGVTVNLIVVGRIQGKGGAGGKGADAFLSPPAAGSAGAVGGIALYTRRAINLNAASGEVWSGGGGGGGSGGFSNFVDTAVGGNGGGGGAGSQGGAGGALGSGFTGNGGAGAAGTANVGGAGGVGGAVGAGAGAGPGLSGTNGGASTSAGGAGAAAGSAIDGISFVTFTGGLSPSGDLRGSQVN